ncbi:MAG: isoprenoid biosynthesis glyoxalase ElbB [Proteobacteria bacterium]|nr:isoprenoid biosynthesis glyoxalase ElbB [Pseudomonadota bacterium]
MMKKIGVIISGCGVFDGAEIQETVATLAALDNHGLEAVCLAPDIDQMHVVNHLTSEVMEGEKRNVLVESARIARGNISALNENSGDDLDALILPGGFGAAKNLSNYAVNGAGMEVDPMVAEVVNRTHKAGKPVAALCIAPVILARLLKDQSPKLTLGAEGPDAENIAKMGGRHQATTHEEVVVDTENKLITGPCYMLDANIGNIIRGADAVVSKLKELL